MKQVFEILAETSAVTAAVVVYFCTRSFAKAGSPNAALGTGLDDPRALLRMVYEQSQWSALAAIAAGLAALFALADGLPM